MRKCFSKLFLLLLLLNLLGINAQASIKNDCKTKLTDLEDLILNPKDFVGKKIQLGGMFYSFTTLPLDYDKAMRNSKDFIGIMLARPDQEEIPLVELKMAVPIKMFKENSIPVEHGDSVILEGKVFEVALGEPWLDITDIFIEESDDD